MLFNTTESNIWAETRIGPRTYCYILRSRVDIRLIGQPRVEMRIALDFQIDNLSRDNDFPRRSRFGA